MRELQEGTRRIAGRDFGSRVTVTQPGRVRGAGHLVQRDGGAARTASSRRSSTAAEIDRAVLSATGRRRDRGHAARADAATSSPATVVGVTLMAPDGAKSLSGVVYDYCDDSTRHQARVDLRAEDVQELLDGPRSSLVDVPTVAVTCRLSGAPASARSRAGLSCSRSASSASWSASWPWAIAARDAPEPDERLQLRRLADQVAVALANARMLEQVTSLAYYDSLTGLPNRLSYKERLAQALEHAQPRPASWWRRSSSISITSAGSTIPWATRWAISCSSRSRPAPRVLPRARGRGRAGARHALAPEVARLGGDEFTVIMPGLTHPEDAAKLARRILTQPGASDSGVAGQEIFVNASIGIAIYPVRRRGPRDPADARRHRDVQGEGAGRQQLPDLLAIDEHDARSSGSRSRTLSAGRWSGRSSRSTTSRSSTADRRGRSGRRRSCAGAIRSWACCCRRSSSRWPRRTASSCRSANGCCSRPACQNRAWQDAGSPPDPGRGEPVQPPAQAGADRDRRPDPSGDRPRGPVSGSGADRERAGESSEGRHRQPCTRFGPWGCTWRWTTSGPGTRRSATSSTSRSTR